MQAKERLSLQPSEAHVLGAAAQIYAAYLISGRVPTGDEQQWAERAVEDALHMALRCDARIQSDDEVAGGLGSLGKR